MLSYIHYEGSWGKLLLMPLLVLSLVTLLLGLLFSLVWDQSIWDGWTLGMAGTFAEFCERNRMEAFIRQPANTWSNLAYLFYGLICIQLALHDRQVNANGNFILRHPVVSWVFGFTFAYLCFGSFFYHASLTRIGQHFDMGGTYALVAFPVLVNLARIYRRYVETNERKLAIALVSISFLVFALIFAFKWHLKAESTLGGLILGVIVTTIWYHHVSRTPYKPLFGALAVLSMALAYGIWWQDRYKHWCDPESWLQGHALWHVLTGLGGFFVYLMIRSETATDLPTKG